MEKRMLPPWSPPLEPNSTILPNLKLLNSFTSAKDKFIPQNGKTVKWYTCGPTVYDYSHMGHARTYIAFDALRRVLKDYFLFDVIYVLNITDVDDKIIKRARQNHLINEYLNKDNTLVDVYDDLSKAVRNLKQKSNEDPDIEKRCYFSKEADRIINLLGSQCPPGEDPVHYLINSGQDAIADVLDLEFGASITNHRIFGTLAQRFEAEFHKDMLALNVLKPDVLVRVTEYVDAIVSFIQRIIDNGFGYIAPSGSVYFDTNKFATDPAHFYGKLVPTAYGDTDKLAMGEGELTIAGEKRSSNDFALWKSSKHGEPAWNSPWGLGRPGWHIECSVMASTILGDSIDIHGGGVDLKFPHHDNELAQSEAYFGHSHWVYYFLHSGHLTIAGCKMSKSLKNFVTIQDALKHHSARRLRLLFLLHSWHDTMDYSEDTMAEAISYEKMLVDFCYNAANLQLLVKHRGVSARQNDVYDGHPLFSQLKKTQYDVYDALCDSCDIRRTMSLLKELICLADQYAINVANSSLDLMQLADLVYLSASFVLRVLRIFGIADLTLASIGTPVPADGIVAGGTISADQQPLQLHSSIASMVPSIEQRCWLSLDTITLERVSTALQTTLFSTQTLAKLLLTEDSLFSPIVTDFSLKIQKQFGVDIFDLPGTAIDSLTTVFQTATKLPLSDVLNRPHGLETEVWASIAEFLLQLTLLRQTARAHLLTLAEFDKIKKQRILTACDQMRDVQLAEAGVRLQDRASTADLANGIALPPSIGLVDAAILRQELADRKKRSNEKTVRQLGRGTAPDNNDFQHPAEFFRSQMDKYSAFDDKGIPTHDASGKEISRSQFKKLKKIYDTRIKRYDMFMKTKSTAVTD